MPDIFFSTQELGKRVAEIRGNITQKELAKAIGVSRSYIGNIEQGITMPSLEVIMSIAEQCNVSLDWLVYGNPPSHRASEDANYFNKSSDYLLCREKSDEKEPSFSTLPLESLQQFEELAPQHQKLVIEFIKMLAVQEREN